MMADIKVRRVLRIYEWSADVHCLVIAESQRDMTNKTTGIVYKYTICLHD
jgi:hypothetical protein